MKNQDLSSVTGCSCNARRTAFERRDALLEHRGRWITDPRVDVAERLQAKQRSSMIDAFKDIGRRLIDRRGARAGGRIGLGAGMNGERGKARNTFVHRVFLLARSGWNGEMGEGRFKGPGCAVKARRNI